MSEDEVWFRCGVNVRPGQWGKEVRGTFSCCPPKTNRCYLHFFGDWVYLFQDKLRVDANHPVILLDEHSAYMKLEAAENVTSDLFPIPHDTNHEIQPLSRSFVSPSRVSSCCI